MIRTAETENGKVRGIEAADPRITAFKGIPFAAPPVGMNRWRAPQPCPDWKGVLEAYRFGPIAVQYTPGAGDNVYVREWHVDGDIAMDEDCLQLNIWTPAKSQSDKLPVYVWYFGGALQCGYPAEMEFDGERLARRGIVVVTVNYRVNVFGFLAHPEITEEAPEAPANFGHLDQQAGLKWVVRNITSFGGDPDNITIGGQSAGGGSVMYQMACMENAGYFKRAIIQSGVIMDTGLKDSVFRPLTLNDAEKLGEGFFDFLGVKTLNEARSLDARFIFKKYEEFGKMMMTVLDGKFCTGSSYELFMSNKYIHVPMLAGNTADEFPAGIGSDKRDSGTAGKKASVIEPAVKAMFRLNEKDVRGGKCFYYRFDADIPGDDNAGNFHSVDLWFFFETLAKSWRPFKGRHYDLARQMCNYWSNFIRCGDPNGKDADGSDMPEWRPYRSDDSYGLVFSDSGIYAQTDDDSQMRSMTDRIINSCV